MSLSFSFKKKIETKVIPSTDNEERQSNKVDYLEALDERELVSNTSKNVVKKELVIPLIKRNVYCMAKSKSASATEVGAKSLDEEAAREIIRDSKSFLEKSDDDTENFEDLAIPLLLKNKVPEGFETDDKLDVSLRPDEATEAQYDQIPVAAFGLAVLRGMGWTPEVGIGKTFKVNTKMLEQKIRPKGLGLGADVSPAQVTKSTNLVPETLVINDDDDVIENDASILVKGANVLVTNGSHKNKYGKILAIDIDTNRLVVKMAIGGKTEHISRNCVKAVSKKEYDCNAKDLSRFSKAYTGKSITIIDDNKERNADHSIHETRERNADQHSPQPKEKRRKKEDTSTATSDKHNKHKTRTSQSVSKRRIETWVRPQIRVRIVDKKYRKGRYYREKVIVEDILGRGKCCCRTDDGKVLDDINDSMLETVIPKSSSDAYVIIVHSRKGLHNGKLAKILEKDKQRCEAMLQLIEDRDVVVKVAFEDMCEFTGDPEMNAMF